MAHLGDKLKDYRIGQNWKQPEMAKYLSIGYRAYQDIEKTGVVIKLDVLERIKTKTGIDTQISAHDNGDLMPVLVQLMKTQNRILEDQKTELVERMKKVETNLDFVVGKAEALEYDVLSGTTVVLQSLARLEGKDSDALLNEAGKIRLSQVEAKDESYKKYGIGKMNRKTRQA